MKRTFVSTLALAAAVCMFFAASAFADTGELGGTSWLVTGINNGRQAVISVLPGTELTAKFDRNGIMSGSAGCNSYTTTYDLYGNIIKIGPAAATRKIASTPAGIMEQETMFLDALEKVRSWRMDDADLTLSGEDGSTILTLALAKTGDSVFFYKNSSGREASVRILDRDKLMLAINAAIFPMKQTISADGAKYVALDNANTIFWSKGNMAYITVNGRDLGEFSLVDSGQLKQTQSMRPTVYRAGVMEVLVEHVDNDRILLIANGETFWLKRVPSATGERYLAESDQDTKNPSRGSRMTEFWIQQDQATLTVRGVPYPGGMLTRDDGPYVVPAATLMDVEWHVESIAGKNILPGSTVTMFFKSDGTLFGKASVNQYNSSWVDSENRIWIGETAVTMMSGEPELMEQEATFLQALPEVHSFEIKSGKLHLTLKDGREIVARR